jgi:hypothetical protein
MTYNNVAKHTAIEETLRLHPDWSNRKIGAHCNASHVKVGNVRKTLVAKREITVATKMVTLNNKIIKLKPTTWEPGVLIGLRFAPKTEKELEVAAAAYIKQRYPDTQTQVSCLAGRIDIVNAHAIYEVELHLTKNKLFEAIGQVLLYRQALGGERRAYILCGSYGGHLQKMVTSVRQLGIDVIRWRADELVRVLDA